MSHSQDDAEPAYRAGDLIPMGESDLFGSLVQSVRDAKAGASIPRAKLFTDLSHETLAGWVGAKELLGRAEKLIQPVLVETAEYQDGLRITLGRLARPGSPPTYRVIVWKGHVKQFEKDVPGSIVAGAQGRELSALRAALANDAELRHRAAQILSPGIGFATVEAKELDAIAAAVESGEKSGPLRM